MTTAYLKVEEILQIHSNQEAGVSLEKDIHSLYEDFIFKEGKIKSNIKTFHKTLTIITRFFPIIGTTTAALVKDTAFYLPSLFVSAIIYLLFIILEATFPKDLDEYNQKILHFKLLKVINILSAEVSLYSRLQEIDHTDDEEKIKKLSLFLHEPMAKAIEKDWIKIKGFVVDKTYNHEKPQLTSVTLTDVPSTIYDYLQPVAEEIARVCNLFFGKTDYTVKIYLKTKHDIQIEGKEVHVEMLSSLVRFPVSSRTRARAGRSWLKCNGNGARVWELLNSVEDVICRSNESKGLDSDEKYASIAYIKLPYGTGVLTIESRLKDTFANNEIITKDVKNSLMTVTYQLTKLALIRILQ